MTLTELHDAIKIHPYRLSFEDKYFDSYKKLCFQLLEEFFSKIESSEEYVSSGTNKPSWKFYPGFYHDFSWSISNLHSNKDALIHFEICLGIVHIFIDTNSIPVYYTYYSGSNILKAMSRRRKIIYDDNLKCYSSTFSEEELNECIKEIEDFHKEHGRYDYIRSEGMLEYLKGKIKEMKSYDIKH